MRHATTFRFFFTLSLAFIISSAAIRAAFAEEENELSTMPVSRNQMIKITDHGLVPPAIEMTSDDSIVFFYNDTSDALATLEVNFGNKKTHCASTKMVIKEAGIVRSTEPFGPKEFTSTCFHDKGTYPFTIYGLAGHPKGVSSTITVR